MNRYLQAFKQLLNNCRKVALFRKTNAFKELLKYIYVRARYGYISEDYFMVRGGFERKISEIKDTITYRRWLDIRKFANDHIKEHILLNKVETYKYFSDFVHHKWIYPRESNLANFKKFISSVDRIICKPLEDQQGHGVELFLPSGNPEADFKYCVDKNLLLDECIKQDSCMSFGNKSVNTIRVYTIIDTCGKAHVVQTILRVGVGDSVVDNYCSGGCIYPVDIQSGRVDNTGWGHGADYSGIMIHPGTDIKMLGYQIPYWNDVKRYSCSLAEHLPEVRCVGWDIVVADNPCHVDFIEGNHDAHSGLLAMDNKITYTQLKSLIYDK